MTKRCFKRCQDSESFWKIFYRHNFEQRIVWASVPNGNDIFKFSAARLNVYFEASIPDECDKYK